MISLIRKNQQVLMVLVTVLVIIAFVWLYNGVRWEKMGANQVAEVYGDPVKQTDIEQSARKLNLAADLGLMDFAQLMAAIGPREQQGAENFIWNLMVLQHEADRLEIEPTDEETIAAIEQLPAFQTGDQFDSQKYALFAENRLSPRGFTEKQLQEVVRDQLKFKRLQELVGATVSVPEAAMREMFDRQNALVKTQVVRIPAGSVESEVQVSDEELRQAFEQQKDSLKSPEERAVTAAKFTRKSPPPDKEDPRDRVRALQEVADRAEGFGVRAVGEGVDFAAAAQEAGAELVTVPAFAQSSPPAALAASPDLAAAAFSLTPEQRVSGVQQVGADTFYVLKLGETVESKPLTFEEAEPELRAKLRAQRIAERLNLKAAEVHKQIAKGLESGQSFDAAASAAGLKAEDFADFSMANPKFDSPDAPAVMQTAMTMKEKSLSQPVPTQDGSLLVFLKARETAPDADFAKEKEQLSATVRDNSRTLAFVEWLRGERERADIRVLAR